MGAEGEIEGIGEEENVPPQEIQEREVIETGEKMISKVEIENFQSHKKTVIEFVPGTNVIIGASDSGKSAVFRAINWVISNRPLGDSYRSEWGGDTRVALFTTEGNVIERIKSSNENKYVVNGKSLKAFGTEVPEEVSQVLQIEPANIQSQMESYFLLSYTPGEAARFLNTAASIDDIDRTIASLLRAQAELKQERTNDNEKFKQKINDMRQYELLPEIENKLIVVEKSEESFNQLQDELNKLTLGISQAERVNEKLELIPDLSKALKIYDSVYSRYIEHNHIRENFDTLLEITQRACDIENELSATEGVDSAESTLKQTEKRIAKRNDMYKRIELIRLALTVKTRIQAANKDIDNLENEYQKMAPETCPLCGNKIELKPV